MVISGGGTGIGLAAAHAFAADGDRVLFLSSIAAYRGSGTGAYAASKAALHPYAFDLAASWGRTASR